MSLHSDLLEQAEHLASREARRPRQASLRRATSAAYYALFHLLVGQASAMLIRGGERRQALLRGLVRRAFDHATMNRASRAFASGGSLERPLQSVVNEMTGNRPVDRRLRQVAQAFVDLQQARHQADYNLSENLSRDEVKHHIRLATAAVRTWNAVRSRPEARAYLSSLLLYGEWRE